MTCLSPLLAWRRKTGRDPNTGSWPLVFDIKNGDPKEGLQIPCGQCLGCRLDKAKNWAIRCMNEAHEHEDNCFITLTYNTESRNKYCLKNGKYTLNKREFVLFMKRFRKMYGNLRFFHAAEYGDRMCRPHHHACIFGFDFPDKILYKQEGEVKLYISPSLQKLWQHGYSTIGSVNWDTASYVAKYVTKKITGEKAAFHYKGITPEYVTMSRRPGIGRKFVDKYMSDIYNYDKILVNGMLCRPPRYYDNIYDIKNHDRLETLKKERIAKINPENFTAAKLARKREALILKHKKHKRRLENGNTESL